MANVVMNRAFMWAFGGRVERAATVVGEALIGDIGITLSGVRSGREYRVPGTRRKYRASAPGQAPASRTGQLRQRRGVRVERNRDSVIVFVGSNVPYARHLERGTANMAPRPFARVTYVRNRGRYRDLMRKVAGLRIL